jgi:uncharacterized protein (TIGR04255 family)
MCHGVSSIRVNMSTWPSLSRAPIVEGLIDIRVEQAGAASMGNIQAACDDLAAEFPSRQELHRFTAQFKLSADRQNGHFASEDAPQGLLLRSVDEKWVVQFRLDGFTVSRLQPYGTWDQLRAKTADLWATYAGSTSQTKVVRVASRFINRIPLPAGESFDTTFLTNFVLGPELPQSVAGYLLRVIVPFEEDRATAVVTQTLEENGEGCIFDLEAFSETPQGMSVQDMWRTIERLREIKNRLFFGSLTSAALERFK